MTQIASSQIPGSQRHRSDIQPVEIHRVSSLLLRSEIQCVSVFIWYTSPMWGIIRVSDNADLGWTREKHAKELVQIRRAQYI